MDLFVLEENENYDKRCGEMFFTTKGRIVLHCTLCDDKFISFNAFFAHFLDLHIPEEVENEDDDLIEIDYSLEGIDDIAIQPLTECTKNKNSSENKSEIDGKLTIDGFDVTLNDEKSAIINCKTTDSQIQENPVEERTTESIDGKNSTKGSIDSLEIPIKVRDVQRRLFPKSNLIPIEERKHKCPICGFGFKSRHNMIHHLKRHTDKKDHKCLECVKAFYTSSELRTHMRSHENGQERPFLCTECGACFYDNCDLMNHMKRHSGIKDINCDICNKKFFDNNQLRSHMKVHSFNRTFTCKVCEINFKDFRRLQSHMKAHDIKREFCCGHCGETFQRKFLLLSHVNISHNIIKK